MKSIVQKIYEATSQEGWIAIEVTTKSGFVGGKDSTSQRVVSIDAYNDMREKGHTRGLMQIKHLEKLSPVCKTKDQAMEYIDIPVKVKRKSKIKAGDEDYIVWAISCGKMNPSGKTKWDWNLWEEEKDCEIYILGRSTYGDYPGYSYAFGAPGTLKEGDRIYCVDNDTEKKLSGCDSLVLAVSKCNYDDFTKVFRDRFPRVCKSPKYAFGKKIDGIPWQKMGQVYSIKGVIDVDTYNKQ